MGLAPSGARPIPPANRFQGLWIIVKMSLLRLGAGEFLAGRFRGVGPNVNQRSFSQTELQVLQVYQSIRCIRCIRCIRQVWVESTHCFSRGCELLLREGYFGLSHKLSKPACFLSFISAFSQLQFRELKYNCMWEGTSLVTIWVPSSMLCCPQ